jgi:anti-sigma regulatory factor (Ser/Thr protein kinase)
VIAAGEAKLQHSVLVDTEAKVCSAQSKAELHSSLELVIDVTPQIFSINKVINSCIDFLENHGAGCQTLEAFRLVASEALANAIEHGILCLPSLLKEDPFHPFHEVLRYRLNDIKPGQVFLKVQLLHEDGDCESVKAIGVEVKDSGPGFEWRDFMANPQMPAADKPYGRGLALINMTAGPLTFNDSGNMISFILPCQPES